RRPETSSVSEGHHMKWTKPHYSRAQVDAAGAVLIDPEAWGQKRDDALTVINDWRSAHYYPLNTFQILMRRNARNVSAKSTVVQRVKRLPAIRYKLTTQSPLTLSEMQDIGGCRAVVSTVGQVLTLVERFKTGKFQHVLDREDDYIREPKY